MFTTAGKDCTKVCVSVRKPRDTLMSLKRRKNRAMLITSPQALFRSAGMARSRKPVTATKKSTLYMKLLQYTSHPIAAMSSAASSM